jgi:hypothetical protein
MEDSVEDPGSTSRIPDRNFPSWILGAPNPEWQQRLLNPNKLFLNSRKYILDIYPGSGYFYPSRILDPGVKKHWIPDPGAATLMEETQGHTLTG